MIFNSRCQCGSLANSLLFILMFVAFSGCTNYYKNNRYAPDQQQAYYNRDSGYCTNYAAQRIQVPQIVINSQGSSSTYGNLDIYDNYGGHAYGTYSSRTQYNNPMALGADIANIVSAFSAMNMQNDLYSQCMNKKGWTQVDGGETQIDNGYTSNDVQVFEYAYAWKPEKIVIAEDARARKLLNNERLQYVNIFSKHFDGKFLAGNMTAENVVKSANDGNSQAQCSMGYLSVIGLGSLQDYVSSKKWFEEASKKQNALSYLGLGLLYEDELGVPQDYDKSIAWYKKAADAGSDEAEYGLGYLHYSKTKDYKQAFECFSKSAEKGNSWAQYFLGIMYNTGLSGDIDKGKAFEMAQKSAQDGNIAGEFLLSLFYFNGVGIKQDYKLAHEWAQKSAEKGYSKAQNLLGKIYEDGLSVGEDRYKAFEYYFKAAKQGYFLAQFNLAEMYDHGMGQISRGFWASFWYEKSAMQGFAPAQCELGIR